MMTASRPVLAIAFLGAALAGCDYLPFGYTPLKEITANAAAFDGKEVKIKGRVVDVVKLPVIGKSFALEQDGAQVLVLTQGELPVMKSEVALKGTVRSAIIIGGNALGMRVEESARLR